MWWQQLLFVEQLALILESGTHALVSFPLLDRLVLYCVQLTVIADPHHGSTTSQARIFQRQERSR